MNDARLKALRMIGINENYHLLDEDYHGYIVFIDDNKKNIVFSKAFQLDRPIEREDIGMISRREYEKIIDSYLEEYAKDVSMFIRFDVFHVWENPVTKVNIIKQYVDLMPYEDEEGD